MLGLSCVNFGFFRRAKRPYLRNFCDAMNYLRGHRVHLYSLQGRHSHTISNRQKPAGRDFVRKQTPFRRHDAHELTGSFFYF